MKDNIGKVLNDRYILNKVIGSGGMAVVYLATDNLVGKVVAIKILKEQFGSDEQFLRRFSNESKAIAMMNHENVVNVYDVNLENTPPYIVMEYLDGVTLKEYIEKKGILSTREAVFFIKQILLALAHAHSFGIIHRDIKPQNTMLLRNGCVKVTDFGIASISKDETVTMSDKAIGTVHYISPEQASGKKADKKSDIYSVGVMLYEMLTGQLPFEGETAVSVALKQVQLKPKNPSEINSAIPIGLEEIILKAMLKNPNNRFASAEEMLDALNKFSENNNIVFGYDFSDDSAESDISPQLAAESDMLKKKEKKKRILKYTVAPIITGCLAAFLVVWSLYALLTGGIFGSNKPDDNVIVPNFVGMYYTDVEANEELKQNFNIVAHYDINNDYEYGVIFAQDIAKNTSVSKGYTINLSISKGSDKLLVPDIAGGSISQAETILKNQGIIYTVRYEASETVLENNIIRTDPEGGTEITADTEVVIYVSTGKTVTTTYVPNFIGASLDEAKSLANSKNLTIVTAEAYDENVRAGYVVSQSIDINTEVAQGTVVNLVISKGPKPVETVTLPIELSVGSPLNYAIAKLDELKIQYTITEYGTDQQEFDSTIKELSHSAGEQIPKNTVVVITVWKYEQSDFED